VALAISACGWVSAALLGVALWQRRQLRVDSGFWRRMACIVLATALMGIAIAGLQMLPAMLPDAGASSIRALVVMTVLVLLGLGVYVGVLRLLGVVRITEFFDSHRRAP
jgi:putative peptidoglycan lipid II flippase